MSAGADALTFRNVVAMNEAGTKLVLVIDVELPQSTEASAAVDDVFAVGPDPDDRSTVEL